MLAAFSGLSEFPSTAGALTLADRRWPPQGQPLRVEGFAAGHLVTAHTVTR